MAALSSEVTRTRTVGSDSAAAEATSWLARHSASLGYALAALAIWLGWMATRGAELVNPEAGLGYWLGILGASLMAILLLYPLRKRLRWMRGLGPTRYWFRVHMIFGVLGPILILYHCNFSLGSLNSNVALACTLLVAGSGLVGRYLHARVHIGLDGHRATLRELTMRARITDEQRNRTSALVPHLLERMQAYDRLVLEPPKGFAASMLLPLRLAVQTRWKCIGLCWFAHRQLRLQARRSTVIAAQRRRLQRVTFRFISEHLRRVRRVAELSSCERLFALWHVFHLPFFYMLVLTALLHVLGVHMY
jgi:hypothetical protein